MPGTDRPRTDEVRCDGWIVFGLALGIRAAYLASLHFDPALASIRSVDTLAYLDRAQEILDGRWSAGGSFHSGFIYPYLLAALGGSATATLALQALLDAASAVLVWRLGRRVGRVAGLVGGLLYATAAVAVFGAGTLLFDSVGVFLVLAAVESASVAVERSSNGVWALSGFLLALAASARPFLLAFPPAVLLPLVARGTLRPRAAAIAGGAAALGAALVLAPIAIVHRATTGELRVFPASAGITFYIGNNPLADGTLVFPSHLGIGVSAQAFTGSAAAYPARQLRRAVTAGEASAFWFQEGLAFWRAEPLRALALTARKAALLLNVAEIPDNYDFALARERIALLRWLPGWFPVLAIAPWGILVAVRRRRMGLPLAMAAIHAIVLPLFLATGRLRYAFMAILCAFGGVGIADLRETVRARDRKRGAAALFAAAAASAVALWPWLPAWASPAPGALRHLAAALVANGRPADALGVLARIPEAGSRSSEVVRGDALRALGKDEEALAAYRRAVAYDRKNEHAHMMVETIASRMLGPEEIALVEAARSRGDAAAWLALARRRIDEDRFEVAVRSARASLQAGAGDEGLYLLAVALKGRGRSAESVEAFEALLARRGPSAPLLADYGFALFDDSRPEDARRSFEQALALDPRCAPAFYGLAVLDKLAGRIDAARERCRAIVALEPPASPWASAALRQIRDMEN